MTFFWDSDDLNVLCLFQTPKKPPVKTPGKSKVVEPEFEVSPLPGPSTDFTGSAFRPGVKRAVDKTPTTPASSKRTFILSSIILFLHHPGSSVG